MLTVEANMYAFNGTHWFDKKKKARFMLYAGQTFIWNPTRELWELYTERGDLNVERTEDR